MQSEALTVMPTCSGGDNVVVAYLPYYSESELCGGAVTVSFFEVPPLASDALLTTLHLLLKSFKKIVEKAVLSPRTFQTALVYLACYSNAASYHRPRPIIIGRGLWLNLFEVQA
jgi:hypothetical protein